MFGGATGLHVWSRQAEYRTIASELHGDPLCVNDIIAGPRGQVYAGTFHWGPNGMEKHGRLVRCDPDGSLTIEDEGIEHANGLGLGPDDRTLYFTDSTARSIFAYDVDPATGALSGRRLFVRVPPEEGVPDGLTVDREGYVWSAQWYGGCVVRYDPDGTVERRIALPVLQVSSLAFGGADYGDLYVTTAANSWTSPYAPPATTFTRRTSGERSIASARISAGGRSTWPGTPEGPGRERAVACAVYRGGSRAASLANWSASRRRCTGSNAAPSSRARCSTSSPRAARIAFAPAT